MDEIYYPSRELSIDESMILWRGRLSFTQYVKGKKLKFGVKLYMLAEPTGLVTKILVYTGAGENSEGGLGHAGCVVHRLLQAHGGVGHCVFMDNYFTSVDIVASLAANKILCTGTLRSNRKGNPAEVTAKKIKKGEVVEMWSDDGVCVLKWKDKREVTMISTQHSGKLVNSVSKRKIERRVPEAVREYNKFMGGVDRLDQLLSYHITSRKTLRWYKKVALHIVQIMLLNSFQLYKMYSKGEKMSLQSFRLSIIGKLVSFGRTQEHVIVSQINTPPLEMHFPKFNPMTTKGDRRKQKTAGCVQKKENASKLYTTALIAQKILLFA
jgi:hypothetical protein